MKRTTYSTALLPILAGIALIGVAHADTKSMRIAFSNNYAGKPVRSRHSSAERRECASGDAGASEWLLQHNESRCVEPRLEPHREACSMDGQPSVSKRCGWKSKLSSSVMGSRLAGPSPTSP